MEGKHYINEEGLSEFRLDCGCTSTHIPGVGWMTMVCEEHEEEMEFHPDSQKLMRFNLDREY